MFTSFQASFNEALLLALLAAGVVAILVSLLLSRGVVAPVRVLTDASRRIADGHYGERVQPAGSDELGQLAHSFNQMAEKLEQVEAMRRQLIGDVSHELRTPLTAIKGSMEGLMDGVLPAAPETYQQIHPEADRLARLVDDLQELSRVEAGAYPLDIRPVAVSTLVQTTLKQFASQAQAKRIDLRSDLPADLPPVLADQDRITQVLTNLVGNALQYTPEGGQVTILSRRTPGRNPYFRRGYRDRHSGRTPAASLHPLLPGGQIPLPPGRWRLGDRADHSPATWSRRTAGASGLRVTEKERAAHLPSRSRSLGINRRHDL